MTNAFEQNNQANVPAAATAAQSKPAPKKLLNAFAVRERTPSPPPQNNNPKFPAKKLINANGIFNQDEQKEGEVKSQSEALPKKKLGQFVIQNMDDEEEKKAATKPKPIKKLQSDDGGFMAQLAARLAQGPPAAVQKRPANPPVQNLETPEELVDAKLSIPKMSRSRGVTKKYDVSKYNFENF